MSGLNLNTISENASRLGMRLQETISEHTRDFPFARKSSYLYLDTPDEKVKLLGQQLDSNSDREKLDAMKRLIAFISKGRNVSEYFAQVVKNVASQNLEIRKLVYIYLLHHAEHEPDLALLSINTFQKDLTDPNPLIRAMALRVLSGIKVPMIGSLVVLAIKKCAADVSPYVRTGAALATTKCYKLDTSHQPALIGIISSLLHDHSPLSVGSVAIAFGAVCPDRLDLLHQQYRRLCKILIDVDEWGQIHLLNLLAREQVDADLQLLLTSSEPLLQSRNPAVVLAVARAFYYVGTKSQISKILSPLFRLLHVSNEVGRVVLTYILLITQNVPHAFSPFYSLFLVRANDIWPIKQDKMKILLNIINHDNHQAILREFIEYASDVDDRLVAASIHSIGRCASLIPACTQQCVTALVAMIKNRQEVVVSNAILVLQYLIQMHLKLPTPLPGTFPQSLTIISHLARRVNDLRHSQAKACVLWLVGQYSASPTDGGGDGVVAWAPDVLRKSAKFFCQETPIVKLQIVTLAAKLVALSPNDRHLELLSQFVFSLAKYDVDYDVRDRARMLTSLLSSLSQSVDKDEQRSGVVLRREQVKLVLFNGKGAIIENDGAPDQNVVFGDLGAITGVTLHKNALLLDWPEEGSEAYLRDTEGADNTTITTTITSIHKADALSLTNTPCAPHQDSMMNNVGFKASSTDLESFYADGDNQSEDESPSQDEKSSVEADSDSGEE